MNPKQKSPLTPLAAHHRLLKSMVSSGHGGDGLEPRPEDLDLVGRIFVRAGGSWERVFRGSSDDMVLLKKALKIAVKKGAITKKPQWSG
jgi:hypothetical protein